MLTQMNFRMTMDLSCTMEQLLLVPMVHVNHSSFPTNKEQRLGKGRASLQQTRSISKSTVDLSKKILVDENSADADCVLTITVL